MTTRSRYVHLPSITGKAVELAWQEVGTGFRKADESVLAARPYVLHTVSRRGMLTFASHAE